jgi:hypothetical protein
MYMRGVNKDCHTALEHSGKGARTDMWTKRLISVPPYLKSKEGIRRCLAKAG